MMRLRSMLWVLALALVCAQSALAKDVALISNKGNNLKGLSFPDLLKICKGQMGHWPNGRPVTLITRSVASPDMRIVLQKVYGMTAEEVNELVTAANHGRTDHPAIVVVDSDDSVVKKVQATPGGVGLVDVYSITGGIDVLRVGGKLPLEPGYVLHGN
jgi:ABC-type phosphate transport system substrate-binding protein